MKTKGLALGLALLITTLAVDAQVTDEFTGKTVTMMNEQVAIVGLAQSLADPDSRMAYLKLVKVESEDGQPAYAVSVFITGKRFLFQEHIFIKVGSEVFDVEAKTKDRDVQSGPSITEISLYPVPVEVLQKMATSDDVKVRVQGSRGQMDGTLKKKGLQKIRDWVGKNVAES